MGIIQDMSQTFLLLLINILSLTQWFLMKTSGNQGEAVMHL